MRMHMQSCGLSRFCALAPGFAVTRHTATVPLLWILYVFVFACLSVSVNSGAIEARVEATGCINHVI